MKVKIRFKKNHEMEVDGQMRKFAAEQDLEVEQAEAIRLIRNRIALPGGIQHGALVRQRGVEN